MATNNATNNYSAANGCSFFAYSTTNQTVSAASSAVVTFGSTAFDKGSVFASNTFTAPTSSRLYWVHAHVSAAAAASSDTVSIAVNGTTWASAIVPTYVGGDPEPVDVFLILPLSASDAITVVYTNSAPSVTAATIEGQVGPPTTPYLSWFEAYQLT